MRTLIANRPHATYLLWMKMYLKNPLAAATLFASVVGRIAPARDRRRVNTVLRATLVASAISVSLAASPQAQEAEPDWLPEEIELPADHEVLMDRAIGSAIRMFSISTGRDTNELLEEWEDALREGGYTITQGQGDAMDEIIEFSSDTINNAKIAVSPTTDEGRSTIEFDVTLQ